MCKIQKCCLWQMGKIQDYKKIFPDPISLYCLLKTPVVIKVTIGNQVSFLQVNVPFWI